MTRIHTLTAFTTLALAACGRAQDAGTPEPDQGPPANVGAIELPCDDADVYYPTFPRGLEGRAGELGAWQCGRLDLPWDPEAPADTFSLGYVKLPAADPSKRRGTLVFNPGGPGGSGTELAPMVASRLPAEILEAYDLVGFDPRGTGWSAEVACGFVQNVPADGTPETREELEALDRILADTMTVCREEAPWLTEISSHRVVADMEALRIHFGDDQLDFLGYSYGTRLGSLYAATYPENVGHIVLDAPVSPSTDFLQNLDDKEAFAAERVDELIATCEACGEGFRDDLEDLLAELDAHPMGMTMGGTRRTESELWGYLSDAVLGDVSAFDELVVPMVLGDFEALDAALAARTTPWRGDDSLYLRAMIVNCLDAPALPTFDDVWASRAAADPLAPSATWLALSCRHLLTEDELDTVSPIRVEEGPALLVVGGTTDGNTPYDWSVEMANALGTSVLVTSDHVGHTAVGSSPCVDDIVTSFLVDDEAPAADVACAAP